MSESAVPSIRRMLVKLTEVIQPDEQSPLPRSLLTKLERVAAIEGMRVRYLHAVSAELHALAVEPALSPDVATTLAQRWSMYEGVEYAEPDVPRIRRR